MVWITHLTRPHQYIFDCKKVKIALICCYCCFCFVFFYIKVYIYTLCWHMCMLLWHVNSFEMYLLIFIFLITIYLFFAQIGIRLCDSSSVAVAALPSRVLLWGVGCHWEALEGDVRLVCARLCLGACVLECVLLCIFVMCLCATEVLLKQTVCACIYHSIKI